MKTTINKGYSWWCSEITGFSLVMGPVNPVHLKVLGSSVEEGLQVMVSWRMIVAVTEVAVLASHHSLSHCGHEGRREFEGE